MRQIRLLLMAVFAMFAFGAVASAVANAEGDTNSPSGLILEGAVEGLEGNFEWGVSELSILANAAILQSQKGKGTIKGCKPIGTNKLDTNLCSEGTLTFEEVTTGETKQKCRSESTLGKDPLGTVLVKVDTHLATELSQGAKVLQPLAIFLVLGVDGKDLKINCTAIVLVLGAIPCLLLPGLKEVAANAKEWEIVCETDLTEKKPNGDQLTGTCQQLCESLTEEPFKAVVLVEGKEPEEMAAFLVKAKGSFNKALFIDD